MKKIQRELLLTGSVPSLVFVVFIISSTLADEPLSQGLVAFFSMLYISTTLYLGFKIHAKLIDPLEEIISGLSQDERAELGTEDLSELSLAIDSYITHLEQEFDDKHDKLTNQFARLQSQYHDLERQNSEILDSYKALDQGAKSNRLAEEALRKLCLTALKTIKGFINRINKMASDEKRGPGRTTDFDLCLSEITLAAKSLVFLIQESGDARPATVTGDMELWQFADDALGLLGPIIAGHHCNISVIIDKSCPSTVNIDAEEPGSALFHYLLHYFLHGKNSLLSKNIHTLGGKQDLALEITFSPENELVFTIDKGNYPDASNASTRLSALCQLDTTFVDGSLKLPAKPISSMQTLPGKGLTGIIICDGILQSKSLHSRLSQLGAQIVDDFKTTKLDFCIVDDETGEAFKAVQQYLNPNINMFLLNNSILYQRENWHQLRHPLDQTELKRILKITEPTVQETQSYNILVVDDNEVNLRLLDLQLKELGHSVSRATDGQQAVMMCKEHQFDLVFLDIFMPGMGGVEAAGLIRGLPLTSPPIVGLTAHMSNDERQTYLKSGMSEVIVKPIRMEKLKSVLQRQINILDTKPALPAGRTREMPIFDYDISLSVANNQAELADEFLAILVVNLAADQQQINSAFRSHDLPALKRSVHKLNGAVKYCGVPRLASAIDKLESIAKSSNEDHIKPALTLLNSEIGSLNTWYRENPEPFRKPSGRADKP